jgi:hypothetical protein
MARAHHQRRQAALEHVGGVLCHAHVVAAEHEDEVAWHELVAQEHVVPQDAGQGVGGERLSECAHRVSIVHAAAALRHGDARVWDAHGWTASEIDKQTGLSLV